METILVKGWAVITTIGSVILKIMDWINKYQAEINAIALRIEKDSADGKWSNREKVEHAWDVFKKKAYPGLNWKIKMFIKFKGEKKIKAMFIKQLDKICTKSHDLKNADDADEDMVKG